MAAGSERGGPGGTSVTRKIAATAGAVIYDATIRFLESTGPAIRSTNGCSRAVTPEEIAVT
jgi:hypothetical protein